MKRPIDPERITKPIRTPLDTRGFALEKPQRPEHSQPKDGRLIEKPTQYKETKRLIWQQQNYRCAKCNAYLPSPAFGHRHHIHGRGMGSGKRSDAIEHSEILCAKCHGKVHGQ